MASIVDGWSRISPAATARRSLSGLSPTSTICTSPSSVVWVRSSAVWSSPLESAASSFSLICLTPQRRGNLVEHLGGEHAQCIAGSEALARDAVDVCASRRGLERVGLLEQRRDDAGKQVTGTAD